MDEPGLLVKRPRSAPEPCVYRGLRGAGFHGQVAHGACRMTCAMSSYSIGLT